MRGVSHQSVTAALQGGRLVLRDGRVDVDTSDQLTGWGDTTEEVTASSFPSKADSERAKVYWQAEAEQLKVRKLRGELLDRGEVIRTWAGQLAALGTHLRQLHAQATIQLGLDDHQRQKLQQLVQDGLQDMSQPFEPLKGDDDSDAVSHGGSAAGDTPEAAPVPKSVGGPALPSAESI